jgi:hypothetical protein
MAVGHSDDIDPEAAVATVVAECERALDGVRPTAGLLFLTYDADPTPFVSGVRAAYPDIDLVGSTSIGEMSSTIGFREDSLTLALFASDTVDIVAGGATGVATDPLGAARRAIAQARAKSNAEPRLCLTLPSVAVGDPTPLLEELRRELGDDVLVFGGGSGPRLGSGPSMARQFFDDEILQDAVTVLLFCGPVTSSFGIENGWRPVGRTGIVTDASGFTIRTIDDEPAIAFFERYLGHGAKPTAANPLAVFDGDSERFHLRVAIGTDPATGAIEAAGDVSVGARVQLAVAVIEDVFDGTRSSVQQALKMFPSTSSAEAALVFSCAIRKWVLGTRTGMELDITRQELGPGVPIAGLYCYGEIAPLDAGGTAFHNETFVTVLLGETEERTATP